MPALIHIDLKTTSVASGSSSGGRGAKETPARDTIRHGFDTRNLFDKMPTTDDNAANRFIINNMIFEGGVGDAPFDPGETQSQDGRKTFMRDPFVHGGTADPFMQGQDGMGTFPTDHEFPEDYSLEEEDEVDIDGAPLFEEDLSNQAQATKKRQSKHINAYTKDEDRLLCECWRDTIQDPRIGAEQNSSTFWFCVHREFHERKKFMPYKIESKCKWVSISKRWRVIQQECNKFCASLESIEGRPVGGLDIKYMAFKAQHEKSFNLVHCWMVINSDEKFRAQHAVAKARGGTEAVEEHGEGETPRPRGRPTRRKRTSVMLP
ncbi:Lectin-domain containing receptor kinase A4.3 [Hordeum vulgare]|nr:Lectin-domain containing receptor kinase A4.3 [Hordeum vulgare]